MEAKRLVRHRFFRQTGIGGELHPKTEAGKNCEAAPASPTPDAAAEKNPARRDRIRRMAHRSPAQECHCGGRSILSELFYMLQRAAENAEGKFAAHVLRETWRETPGLEVQEHLRSAADARLQPDAPILNGHAVFSTVLAAFVLQFLSFLANEALECLQIGSGGVVS